MRHLLSLTLLLTIYSHTSYAQPLIGIEPLWSTTLEDTVLIAASNFELSNSGLYIFSHNDVIKWGDNIVVMNTSLPYGVTGGYIEYKNLRSGELIWDHSFNHFISGKREVPLALDVDDSGVTVTGLRRSSELFAGIWNMGRLIKRHYAHDGTVGPIDTFDLKDSTIPILQFH